MYHNHNVWVFFIHGIKKLLLVQQGDNFSKLLSEICSKKIIRMWAISGHAQSTVLWLHLSMAMCSRLCGVSGWFISVFLSLPPLPLFLLFHCLCSVTSVLADDWAWGVMAGLRGLPAVGACYCLGASWSQRRPLGLPGYPSSTQLDAVVNTKIN